MGPVVHVAPARGHPYFSVLGLEGLCGGARAAAGGHEAIVRLLRRRLQQAGFAARSVRPAHGGLIAMAGIATLADGSQIFAKTLKQPESQMFALEADGLGALRRLGGVATPDVLAVSPQLLVLQALQPRPDEQGRFWERLGRAVATLHTATAAERFGWHRDGYLGRLRQDNTWDSDGHAFFAQRRILRWLSEPAVQAAFDQEQRRALERLCGALPDLVPAMPPVLTHGDLWPGNVICHRGGHPVLIDPAVSYTWAEVDVSMLWCSTTRPPAADRFFSAYAEIAPLTDGWRARAPLLHLREHLSSVAHGIDVADAVRTVRDLIAPFTRRP